MDFANLKILQIVGPKNAGKTRHVEWLISSLKTKGIKVGAIKHSSHNHPIDRPGSDSYRLQEAGASPTIFWSSEGLAAFYPKADEQAVSHLFPAIFKEVDLVIVESFASARAAKIVIDPDGQQWGHFNNVVAIVSKSEIKAPHPVFKPFDEKLITFVIKYFRLTAQI